MRDLQRQYELLISENPQNWGLTEDATAEEISEMAWSLAEEEAV